MHVQGWVVKYTAWGVAVVTTKTLCVVCGPKSPSVQSKFVDPSHLAFKASVGGLFCTLKKLSADDWLRVHHSISLSLKTCMEMHMFKWYIVPVFRSSSSGACCTQIRTLLAGHPSLLSSWVDMGTPQVSSPRHRFCLCMASHHCCACRCRWSGILLQGPHDARPLFSCPCKSARVCYWYTPEANFRGALETSCFADPCKYLKGVQKEYIGNNWKPPWSDWSLPEGWSSSEGDNVLEFIGETLFCC